MRRFLILSVVLLFVLNTNAQDTVRNKAGSKYLFTVLKNMEATPVQDQFRTSTCWSFSALSFFESELMRAGKGNHNLSEMYIVRCAYIEKAKNYVRMHGESGFAPGGAFHDIPYVIARYGLMPEEAYKGLDPEAEGHNHAEMDAVLKGIVDAVKENPQKKLTTKWVAAFSGAVDGYLGKVPDKFTYAGKEYTPQAFKDFLGLSMDDYVSLTSFTHHPFYSKFPIEVPDNWSMQQSYNLPLEELYQVMESALMAGYTFAWGADVSEKGFSFRDALAIVPVHDSLIAVKGKDNKGFNDAGAEKSGNAFNTPMQEKTITQQMRQMAFDNYETTDDHGMHVAGLVKDQNGTKYFIVKNSWGKKHNQKDGYFFASSAYMQYKTINIYLHKNAVPKNILKKLNII